MSRSWLQATGLAVLLAGLTALSWQGAEGAGGDKTATETLPADLARVPARSLALFSVRSADVWTSSLAKGLREKLGKEFMGMLDDIEKKTGLSPADVERVTIVIKESPDAQPLVFFGTTKPFDRVKVFATIAGGKEEKYGGESIFANDHEAAYVLGEKAFAIGAKGDVQSLIDAGKEKPTGALSPALALAAKKHSLVVGINPAILAPVEDKLPAEAEPFKPLFKAAVATLSIDIGAKTNGNLRIAFPGSDEAAAGVKAVETGRKLVLGFLGQGVKELSKDKSAKALVEMLEIALSSLKDATIKQDGSAVLGHLEMKIDQATAGTVAAEAVMRMRQSAARSQSANNLKQLGLAMHNYHDTTGAFPAQAISDKDGKALLSWRVLILPYIEQNNLYQKFHLDEAWDSAHNKTLLETMPKTYMAPNAKPKNRHGTFYQAFVGKGAFFEGKKALRFADITDGTSNTFMFVEAGTDVPWTKPEDLPFDPAKPLPKLGGVNPGVGFNATICDGSVRFFSSKVKEATLKKWITRNGGEVIGTDE
jgi:hypothetical protein